ncbi:MAG: hypothetical protein V1925_03440 [Candidatus Omnitrophota bacterium]
MKRLVLLFSALTLLIGLSLKVSLAQTDAPPSAEGLGKSFSSIAMACFRSNNPGQDTSLLASRVQDYGSKMAEALLKGKVEPQAVEAIITESAPWYAEALSNLLNGDNSLNFYINEYIRQITDLFSRNKIGLDPQSQIVLLTSSHLEKMYSLLKPSFYHYQ